LGDVLPYEGLDQANIAIPRSLAGRGEADLVLRVDGKTSKYGDAEYQVMASSYGFGTWLALVLTEDQLVSKMILALGARRVSKLSTFLKRAIN
jgi:hypothetical protein